MKFKWKMITHKEGLHTQCKINKNECFQRSFFLEGGADHIFYASLLLLKVLYIISTVLHLWVFVMFFPCFRVLVIWISMFWVLICLFSLILKSVFLLLLCFLFWLPFPLFPLTPGFCHWLPFRCFVWVIFPLRIHTARFPCIPTSSLLFIPVKYNYFVHAFSRSVPAIFI